MNRLSYLSSVLAGSVSALVLASAAQAESFDIPAGDLKTALGAYVAQTGVQLIVAQDVVEHAYTHGARGDLSARAALERILAGTGYRTRGTPSGAIGIVRDISDAPRRADTALTSVRVAAAASSSVETVVVTSSKIKGDIQTVPIAITALSQEQLTERQIAGGPDLVKEVPNLTFSKTNFTGYNIEIRGIGTQAISVTTDPAVAVAFNDTPFLRNHFFEQEFFDVSQVEVLRGPQGTLYGRNATAGVVNVVSAKPTDQFEAMLSADWGNYTNRRYEGMVNLPIVGDKLALRVAGEWTKRDGYSFNRITNSPTDGRDLWSSRASLRWRPVESVTADIIWEHFQENDDRLRSAKQLCKRGDPPATILGVSTSYQNIGTVFLNQGCLPVSMYSPEAFGVPNALALPYYGGLIGAGFGAAIINPLNEFSGGVADAYAGTTQSHNLRVIESMLDPKYRANNDTLEFNLEWHAAPSLTFDSQTGYNRDFLWSTQDFNRFNTQPGIFAYSPTGSSSTLTTPDGNYRCNDGTITIGGNFCAATGHVGGIPTGVFCDPQLGCSNRLVGEDLSEEHAWQFSQELRLASDLKGPFNFSVGGNYMHYETEENYYVFFNTLTMFSAIGGLSAQGENPWLPGISYNRICVASGRELTRPEVPTNAESCLGYIDPNPLAHVNSQGHNYFLSQNPYILNSYALFGEAYYDLTQDVKLTAGLRWTDDQKHFVEIPSELLAHGYGYPTIGNIDQQWKEWTGRFVANWAPRLSFTDQTMIYGSYSHGYKAGGANPPGATLLTLKPGDITNPVHPTTFAPEFNDAFEVGTKNMALDGGLTLNADVFYYDYKGYQISQIVDRTSVNLNFDATVRGAELQATWSPVPSLKFGFAGGYEDTRLANGSKAIDLMDRTAGNPNWVLVRPFVTQASNCIMPAYVVAYLLNQAYGNNYLAVSYLCGTAYSLYEDPITEKTYVPSPTGNRPNSGSPINPIYKGFDPLAGTADDPYTGQNIFDGIDYGPVPNNGAGFYKNLGGNELPNAPHFTVSLTAEYTTPISANWAATLHSDFYWQSQSWARVFNAVNDKIRGYSNVNLALTLTDATGWQLMGYVKNVFDTTAITGSFLNSDDTGLTTNVFLTDPRLYGLRVTKSFDAGEGGFDLFSAADGERPQIWLTVGGNFNAMLAAKNDPYASDYIRPGGAKLFGNLTGNAPPGTKTMSELIAAAGLPSPGDYEKSPNAGFDWEGKLAFQPHDSNWVLKAGIRYGRSGRNKFAHQSEIPGTRTKAPGLFPGKYINCVPDTPNYDACHSGNHRKFIDAHSDQSEQHIIVDFETGVNVGIGLFGRQGEGNVSAGMRLAQFRSHAHTDVNSDPEYLFENCCQYHDVYESRGGEDRSFHGLGPEIAWDADQSLFGTAANGEISLDWGVNAAMLFGRQSMKGSHFTSYCHINISTVRICAAPNDTRTETTSRSRRVAVPNLGGYIGASVRYSNAKISLGYRADEFFNAMDGGQATAKKYDRGFYGPYLNLSIGFGG